MDGDLIKSLAIGIAAGLSSAALLPMLFRGKLRFERELVDKIADQKTGHEKELAQFQLRIEERDELIDRQEGTIGKLQSEVQELHRTSAAQNREVIDTIKFLQGLAGLAQQDRRRSGPGE